MAVGRSHERLDGLRPATEHQGEATPENDVETALGRLAHEVGDGVAGLDFRETTVRLLRYNEETGFVYFFELDLQLHVFAPWQCQSTGSMFSI